MSSHEAASFYLERKTLCLLAPRSLTGAGHSFSPASLNGLIPWPHENCFWDHVKAVTLHRATPSVPWLSHQSKSIRDLSLRQAHRPSHSCHFTTAHGIFAQQKKKKKICKNYYKAKSLVSHFVLVWDGGAWSMSHYSYKIRKSER